jgi:hypothetical protein
MSVDSGERCSVRDGSLRGLRSVLNRQVDAETLEGINEFIAMEGFCKAGRRRKG